MSESADARVLLDHLFRLQAGRIVARLTRLLGPSQVTLAEEAVQEAMLRALQTWPYGNPPDNAAGWLFRVAHNVAIDRVRRDKIFAGKQERIVAELTRSSSAHIDESGGDIDDDELRMIFMCCHPALSRDASVALSLKAIGGFSVAEIARALLAEEPSIAQRISRAKRQIVDQKLTLEMPPAGEIPSRLDAVLEVIYLIFNEGYAAHAGADLIRHDLCLEALRLGRLVAASPIARPHVHALVALMALEAARFPSRVDAAGDLVLFDDQDRARWDERLIALGFEHFDRSIAGTEVSEYHVQAAIAATHARAAVEQGVDWPLVLTLYDQLLSINPSPVVMLNRAVALAKVRGAAAALDAIEPLTRDRKMHHYHLLLAVRGQLLLDLDRRREAADCFHGALACACSDPERRFLQRKLESALSPV